MTRLPQLVAIATVVALGLAGPAEPQDGKGEPFELVRSLQSVQDQIARGNTRAHAQQRVLLAHIAEQFATVDPERWKEPRNARAALVLVLSGGNARVVRNLLDRGVGIGIDDTLLKGALAYAEGRMDEARQLLSGIEARTLDASIAGHVAYMKAELVAQSEPDQALAYLDDARLLSPGTLIEEASLRRQMALVTAADNAERHEAMATRYLRRFPHSVYAGSFRHQFAVGIANAGVGEPGRLARLEVMLGGVAPAERCDVYLTIAKEALNKGNVALAKFAAANAARLAEGESVERARSRLYEGAALVATDELERGIELLSGVERSKLVAADVALLEAGLAVAGEVRRPPEPVEPESTPPQTAAAAVGPDAPSQVVDRARKAITQVDQMLSGARK